jgi:hypothetical protein
VGADFVLICIERRVNTVQEWMERAERAAAYEQHSKTLSEWICNLRREIQALKQSENPAAGDLVFSKETLLADLREQRRETHKIARQLCMVNESERK